jgi:hypothetical protein
MILPIQSRTGSKDAWLPAQRDALAESVAEFAEVVVVSSDDIVEVDHRWQVGGQLSFGEQRGGRCYDPHLLPVADTGRVIRTRWS